MSRAAFIAMTWSPDGEPAGMRLAERLEAEPPWRSGSTAAGWRIWTTVDAGLSVQEFFGGGGLVIGEAFATSGGASEDPLQRPLGRVPVANLARGLSRARWGRYVALLQGVDDRGVYRDPSGGLDAFVWCPEEGVRVVASEIERVPAWLRPRRWALDWNRIAAFLARPAACTTDPLFEGIEAVGPGDLRIVLEAERVIPVWSPSVFAAAEVSGRDAGPELLRRLETCTEAITEGHGRLLFELSGGLDSSTLAGVMGKLGRAGRVAEWLNFNGGAEGDERRFARAVSERLGVALTPVDMAPGAIAVSDLAELAGSPWPPMSGVDAARDRDEVARIQSAGVTGILSGQGGDAVFFQMPSPLVLVDEVRRRGPRALAGDLLPDLARRCNLTVWGVLRRAVQPRPGEVSPLLAASLRQAAFDLQHAWVRDADARGLPPGKRLHIEAVAGAHLNYGQSRRRRHADLLYPFLAQPVVELCLAIPVVELAASPHDREYARKLFADYLPEVVRRRRTKGGFNGYFGRLVAHSAAQLTPYLLDGCLMEAGFLDSEAVRRGLDPVALMQGGRPTMIMWAAAVEAWVRHWQTRLPDSLTSPRFAA